MIQIGITYTVITPESAEYGDAEDRGWHTEKKTWEPGDLREAITTLKDRGYVKPSDYPTVSDHTWFTAYDSGERNAWNFETGAVENLSLHVDGVTLATRKRILRALQA